jgi:hypothetical protein
MFESTDLRLDNDTQSFVAESKDQLLETVTKYKFCELQNSGTAGAVGPPTFICDGHEGVDVWQLQLFVCLMSDVTSC